ncbi:hypothetical protein HU200_042186 [Digitaria exilis]|uniref:Hydrophobic seed protein domain-containing protein n=1 Tax=Digitaria exilis TaxID=1010633 RepID=A0A835EH97_9POAL|nr:hypothetical protein HU200_042186 [Digitaria exilis]
MTPSKLAVFLTVLSFVAFVVHSSAVPTPPSGSGSCPIDALKLNVCANVLNLLKLNLPVGNDQCCPLLQARPNILGINVNADIDVSILLNHCGKTCPADFTCPSN